MSNNQSTRLRGFYLALAGLSFVLGLLGALLPLLPTTPFLLLAVWAASRSSPRFANWLENHPRFGPGIRAWQRERAIPRAAKLTALALLTASWCSLWALGAQQFVLLALGVVFLLLALFLLTRPSPSR